MYQRTSDHTANTQPALDADRARARRRLLANARRAGAAGSDPRSGDGPAVRGRRDSDGAHQPAGRRRSWAITRCRTSTRPAATTISGRSSRRCGRTASRRADAAGLRPQSGVRQLRVSADDDRRRHRVRVRGSTRLVSGLDAAINWSHRFSQFFTLRTRYQLNRLTTEVTPYFANRMNVSGDAHDQRQQPGAGELGSAETDVLERRRIARRRARTRSTAARRTRGTRKSSGRTAGTTSRSAATSAGSRSPCRRSRTRAEAFTFTGAATGSDLADFLLGIPHASSIAFGNADKYLLAPSYDAYFTDDWRFGPGLTLNMGVRWEYEAPITERFGRLVNLDVAPGFTAVSPVVASDPVGPLTGRRYPDSLIEPDKRGIQAANRDRVAAGGGIVAGRSRRLRHLSQYVGLSVDRDAHGAAIAALEDAERREQRRQSADAGQRIRRGSGSPGATFNTFAVDPDFRVGYAENWQASLQRDLPASLTVFDDVPWHQGQPPDAGVPAEHVSVGRGESLPGLSGRIRLSHVERPLHATCRPVPAAASSPQRTDGDGAVHAVESDGRCRRVQCGNVCSRRRRQPRGRHHRAGLARLSTRSGRRRISISVIS